MDKPLGSLNWGLSGQDLGEIYSAFRFWLSDKLFSHSPGTGSGMVREAVQLGFFI